jgi:xylan 1,4-beta-xylosidase
MHILTARHRPDVALQRAGHADLVETQSGETYMVYLCGRPLSNRGRCTLGRETAIQQMTWGADGWLRTTDGEGVPMVDAPAPQGLTPQSHSAPLVREEFDTDTLPIAFQWLRSPQAGQVVQPARAPRSPAASTVARRLGACSSKRSSHGASRRIASAHRRAWSSSRALPADGGLVCYYNSAKFHYFYVSRDDSGKHLRVMSALPDQVIADAFTLPIAIEGGRPIELRVEVDYERLHFAYRIGGGAWQWLPQQFDASISQTRPARRGCRTYRRVCRMACQDLAGTAIPADFDWFEYREREYVVDVSRVADPRGRG